MIIEVATVMFFATVFRTVFGFGEALIAVPLLALVIPVKIAAPLAVLASILIAAYVVIKDWRHIHLKSAGLLILSTVAGLPVGLILLKVAPESIAKAFLACVLLCYSGYSLLRKKHVSLQNDRFAWFFGFLAGITGGAYGMNGPPLAIYGSLRGWEPERFRATLQGYFLPASIFGMIGYAFAGIWTAQVNSLFLWSLPSVVIGIFVGRLINQKMDGRRFARVLHVGLIFIGLILFAQAF